MPNPDTIRHRSLRDLHPVVAVATVVFAVLVVAGVILLIRTQPRIACVRSQILIGHYAGMTEARQTFDSMTKVWYAELDTLKHDYQTAYDRYKIDYQTLSVPDRKKRSAELDWLENNVQRHTETLTQKSKSEEAKITEGVMRQVNTIIEKYGRDNDYDVILGTTLSGSVLYAREAIDITDDLLKELNSSYRPASFTGSR